MRAPDGRTFRPKTQADVNRDGRKADDILSRRLDRQPKIPAASGGVTGVTRITAGSLAQTNAPSPVGSSVYLSDYSVAPLFGEGVSITEGTIGRFTLGAAGFYQCRAYMRLAFDLSATLDEMQVSAEFEGADPYPVWHRKIGTEDGHGGTPALRDTFDWGPFYVDAGGWTGFVLNWKTADHAYLSAAAIDVWRVG